MLNNNQKCAFLCINDALILHNQCIIYGNLRVDYWFRRGCVRLINPVSIKDLRKRGLKVSKTPTVIRALRVFQLNITTKSIYTYMCIYVSGTGR